MSFENITREAVAGTARGVKFPTAAVDEAVARFAVDPLRRVCMLEPPPHGGQAQWATAAERVRFDSA